MDFKNVIDINNTAERKAIETENKQLAKYAPIDVNLCGVYDIRDLVRKNSPYTQEILDYFESVKKVILAQDPNQKFYDKIYLDCYNDSLIFDWDYNHTVTTYSLVAANGIDQLVGVGIDMDNTIVGFNYTNLDFKLPYVRFSDVIGYMMEMSDYTSKHRPHDYFKDYYRAH